MKVYVSYRVADADALVRTLDERLEHAGFEVWHDAIDLDATQTMREQIERATKEADGYVVVISPTSQHSDWVRQEQRAIIGAYWDDPHKPVVPMVVGDTEVPPAFQVFPAVHVGSDQDAPAAVAEVLASLHRPRSGELASPPADEFRARLDGIGRLNDQIASGL